MHHTNLLDWAQSYNGPKYHALLCDPPYHLTSITERFGKANAVQAQYGTDGAFQRASRGFMGKQWDGGDIAFRPETWAALAEHLYPGAFGMAFASSRGWHRMAVAIEDAGLLIHPVILCWSFGSGFPKATRIDTQIDRLAGAERQTVGQRKQGGAKFALTQQLIDNGGFNDPARESFDVTAPATELAQAFAGHRYGLQAMKPALEPIIVFQKPYRGRPVECIAATGAGALWIDGGRVGSGGQVKWDSPRGGIWQTDSTARAEAIESNMGRWPANLILQHTEDCTPGACVAACPIARLGAQSGERPAGGKVPGGEPSRTGQNGIYGIFDRVENAPHDDSGTAARYFWQADWSLDIAERIAMADPAIYTAKANRAEREAGLDPRTVAMMRLLDDSDDDSALPQSARFEATTVDDGRKKSIDNPFQRGETTRRNIHPTVKPLTLARYLATLLLPPERYERRLLVPFAGSGSEMIGAMLAGWDVVDGLELEADHVAIANARIKYWQGRKHELQTIDRPIVVRSSAVQAGQADMFDSAGYVRGAAKDE